MHTYVSRLTNSDDWDALTPPAESRLPTSPPHPRTRTTSTITGVT